MMIAIERCHVILWCSVWPWRPHEKTSQNVPVFRKSPKIHMILVKSLMISKDFAEILLSVISLLLPLILYHLEDFGKIILYNFLWIIFLNIQMAFLFWGSSVMVFDRLFLALHLFFLLMTSSMIFGVHFANFERICTFKSGSPLALTVCLKRNDQSGFFYPQTSREADGFC